MPTVALQIINATASNPPASSGLADSDIHLYLTQENANTAWQINTSATTLAAPLAPGTLPAPYTMADLNAAGGSILLPSSPDIDSARIYISNSADVVTVTTGGTIAGPTASTAKFIYDFVEFALVGGNLNIDTTQVDQLGIPITIQEAPADVNFSAGSGVVAGLDRQTLFSDFKTAAGTTPFADCIWNPGNAPLPLRLMNPADVIIAQLNAQMLSGTISNLSGSAGTWQATFTITGPAPNGTPPTNGGLSVGMAVSAPLIPEGTTVQSLPSGQSQEVILVNCSQSATSPFVVTGSGAAADLNFLVPPKTGLATYFDKAIDALFKLCKTEPMLVEAVNDATLTGSISALSGTSGNWQATFTIQSPAASPIPLVVGMAVGGPAPFPGGATVASVSGSQVNLVSTSAASTNPFNGVASPVALVFGGLQVYSGTTVETPLTDVNGNTVSYTVLQFTGGNETYNICYPFFTTNCFASSQAGKQTPFGKPVPAPPAWFGIAASRLVIFAPPSLMVFGASGVFADSTQQLPGQPATSAILGAIENFVATALARGTAGDLTFLQGSIAAIPPAFPFSKDATVTLAARTTTPSNLAPGSYYLASASLGTVPMTVQIPDSPVSTFAVTAPVNIAPTNPDLLTLSQFYPTGGTFSQFAEFLHDPAVMIGGRAYALPYDDQGGFSSDLNSLGSTGATITLGPWTSS